MDTEPVLGRNILKLSYLSEDLSTSFVSFEYCGGVGIGKEEKLNSTRGHEGYFIFFNQAYEIKDRKLGL